MRHPGEVSVCYLKTVIWKEVLKTVHSFIMWCSNILIELFQVEINSTQRNDKFLNHFVKALNKIICRFTEINTVFQFTNQYAFSFSCTNLLVCLIYFRPPSWPYGSSYRGGATRKGADDFSYSVLHPPLHIFYFINKFG